VPRTLAVEFPFGHTLGQPREVAQQMKVIRQALKVLESAEAPGTIIHSAEMWPLPQKESLKDWQPSQTSPIIAATLQRRKPGT
jgi:D-proline reductase (dithiol) PrdB